MTAERVSAAECRLLLTTTGIGEIVVQRLEDAGFASLNELRAAGVDQVVDHICRTVGSVAWTNRRRALVRPVERITQATQATQATKATKATPRESRPCVSQA